MNLSDKLNEVKSQGLYRIMRTAKTAAGAKIIIDGKKFINFSSNNYLDLAFNEEVNAYVSEMLKVYGTGSAASRLISGNIEIIEQLESSLATFKNKEAALLYPSGYQANVGVISALCGMGDAIIMDKLNHASLWDGAKLSGARIFVYEHTDMNSFEKVLKRASKYKTKLAVTDSLFSMDGDIAPLQDFTQLCQTHGALSLVDEAHATGVFGERGAGLCQQFGVSDKVDIITATLSKALGAQGGFVCASKQVKEYLVNKSRSFIYSTAISPMLAASAIKTLEICQKDVLRRAKLLETSTYLTQKLQAVGLLGNRTVTPIIPIITGDVVSTDSLAAELYHHGIYAPAIRPPTVENGKCRLRLSLTSAHTKENIDNLVDILTRGLL